MTTTMLELELLQLLPLSLVLHTSASSPYKGTGALEHSVCSSFAPVRSTDWSKLFECLVSELERYFLGKKWLPKTVGMLGKASVNYSRSSEEALPRSMMGDHDIEL